MLKKKQIVLDKKYLVYLNYGSEFRDKKTEYGINIDIAQRYINIIKVVRELITRGDKATIKGDTITIEGQTSTYKLNVANWPPIVVNEIIDIILKRIEDEYGF